MDSIEPTFRCLRNSNQNISSNRLPSSCLYIIHIELIMASCGMRSPGHMWRSTNISIGLSDAVLVCAL